ncbi:hypothetical protein, partial [Klebsiella quasipneumoniae]|uniref:hypothetical protein n=1 Tax=Klebsiella quasipneumoniae TaxID=1463165 RepID=UPI000E1FF152
DGASGFDGLQNGNDLVFGESGFAHGYLLQEHNQYAGRSLNVNGPLYRDTYNLSFKVLAKLCFKFSRCLFMSNLVSTSIKHCSFRLVS